VVYFEPKSKTRLKSVGILLYPTGEPHESDKFLPSGRSVAAKKRMERTPDSRSDHASGDVSTQIGYKSFKAAFLLARTEHFY
jgi:hypothetical protein